MKLTTLKILEKWKVKIITFYQYPVSLWYALLSTTSHVDNYLDAKMLAEILIMIGIIYSAFFVKIRALQIRQNF